MSTKKFEIHDKETAIDESKKLLENSENSFGYIPNLHGVLAEAPGLLKAYQELHALFLDSSFNKDEITVVWQTINVEHECHYCVPAHTAIAKAMKVDDEITEALRNKSKLPTDKLQVLHETTLALTKQRGNISEDETAKFYNAGFTQRQLLEIVLALSQKVISNYTNHIANTPIDKAFEKFEWKA
ncbi:MULTISPECIES: carboxymuconolactone decarboxylase family protein [Mesonia]|mgnify:CR=1 FL=1|uniref:carboxymuconolactone decarboxylase family protein n=1 Tax=Mesonia TaxID=232115 RepID=UPI00176346E9|nr:MULTISPECIES: carboxymuconolactone decarboxylase family protein [Mesonia]HIB36691.1 carboxymuconolactone decarboxylase family protein [Mesonia sp.]HIO25837.1 carboxymuconolactone decarboxylase family protein [Flavobacteriaceae bacterium]